MRNMKLSGRRYGITVNAVAPVAATRMGGAEDDDAEPPADMAPELVAPLVAYLCHEDCPVSGEIYAAGGGRFSRIFIATTEGYVPSGDPTPEDVAAQLGDDQRRVDVHGPRRSPRLGRRVHETPRLIHPTPRNGADVALSATSSIFRVCTDRSNSLGAWISRTPKPSGT